jgi:hypothetical protein
VRGLRVALILGVCALACAKRPGADASAAPSLDDETKSGADEDFARKSEIEAKDAPTGDGAGAGPIESEPATLEELTAALEEHEKDLREEGVRLKTYRKEEDAQTKHPKRVVTPTTKPADSVATKKEDPQARICAIATSVCEIRSRICTLATEHEDEPRYAAACKRATNDCKRATEACDDGE